MLPRAGTGDGGEPAADAVARRAVPGNAVARIAADDAASAPSGSRCRPHAGAAACRHDGTGADLPAAAGMRSKRSSELRTGLACRIGYYNGARPLSSLGAMAPDEAYAAIGAGRNDGERLAA